MADIDLPVWSIRPNWKQGILERLDWLTGIETSNINAEQAIAYRLSPRRSFEATFNPVDDVRSYFDLWLHRFGQYEFMLPLWHDAGRLTASIGAGAVSIPVDTTYREFEVGGLAQIVGSTPHDFNVVEITGITAGALAVNGAGVTRAWGKNNLIHPLRRARLSDESRISALTNRVADGTIAFEVNQANDIPDEGAWDGLTIDGLPVMTVRPNYREPIDMQFLRMRELLDNEQGLQEFADEAGRAFTVQLHSFLMRGRVEHWAFRQLAYRLEGRLGAIWVPTYNQDFVLSQARLGTDAFIDIRQIGYAYSGGAEIDGRNRALIDYTTPITVTDVDLPPSATEERLVLSAPLGSPLAAGLKGSFIDVCRLSSDTIEIQHYTDTDGTAESNISFQSFNNDRTAPMPIDVPLAVATERDIPCGEEAPPDPCPEIYNGPLIISIPVATPPITHPAYTSYLQVYMSLSVETPSGDTLQFWNPGTSIFFNASASDPPPAGGPFTAVVYDPICDIAANVTATATLVGDVVTITVEIDDPHFKFAPNWVTPDPGDTTWFDHPYDYGDWVGVNIIGDDITFPTGSFSSSATITVNGVSGPPATSYEAWYIAQASGPTQNGYRYRFVPSLT